MALAIWSSNLKLLTFWIPTKEARVNKIKIQESKNGYDMLSTN